MKSNITLIALCNSFKKEIANNLANKLGMFYIDINELLNYQLQNIAEVISKAGIEYYNEEETKTVKMISSYENSLITLDLDTFFNNKNYKFLKQTSLFIYLKIDYDNYKKIIDNELPAKTKIEKSLNKKVFYERDKIIQQKSEIIVELNNKKDIIDLLIKSIKEFYKEVL